MIVELRYGRRGLPVRFGPECDVTVVRKPPMPVLDDAGAAVQRAFADPVNAAPLRQLATGCRTACILVCDVTRPVPNGLLLRPMIEELADLAGFVGEGNLDLHPRIPGQCREPGTK